MGKIRDMAIEGISRLDKKLWSQVKTADDCIEYRRHLDALTLYEETLKKP